MTKVGAYEAKTKLSELLVRAEKGEVFEITKNGRSVARLGPLLDDDVRRAEARAAADRLLARLEEGPRVSEEEAQRNWEELKREIDEEWGEER